MPVAAGTKRKRGEGQWGARLSRAAQQERGKQSATTTGSTSASVIIDIYSKYGFDSIDPADLRGRFRWYRAVHAAAARQSTAARPRCWIREELERPLTSCCASASTAAVCPTTSWRAIAYISRR